MIHGSTYDYYYCTVVNSVYNEFLLLLYYLEDETKFSEFVMGENYGISHLFPSDFRNCGRVAEFCISRKTKKVILKFVVGALQSKQEDFLTKKKDGKTWRSYKFDKGGQYFEHVFEIKFLCKKKKISDDFQTFILIWWKKRNYTVIIIIILSVISLNYHIENTIKIYWNNLKQWDQNLKQTK